MLGPWLSEIAGRGLESGLRAPGTRIRAQGCYRMKFRGAGFRIRGSISRPPRVSVLTSLAKLEP